MSVHSSDLSPESSKILEKLRKSIEHSLIAISAIEQRKGQDLRDISLNISIPSHEVVYLGMVIEPDLSKKGIKVLSVTPGSIAEKIGLRSNDLIIKVNERDIYNDSLAIVSSELKRLKDGDSLILQVNRGSDTLDLRGRVTSYFVPQVELLIGSEVKKDKVFIEEEDINDGCGKVSVFLAPPISSKIEPAYFTYIDGYKIGREKASFKLTPGWHTIELSSSISRHFGQSRTEKVSVNSLKIMIEADTVYYLGVDTSEGEEAKKAVVWKQESQECR